MKRTLTEKKHRLENLHSQPQLERGDLELDAVSTIDVPALEKTSALLGHLESQLDDKIDSALAEIDSALAEIDPA